MILPPVENRLSVTFATPEPKEVSGFCSNKLKRDASVSRVAGNHNTSVSRGKRQGRASLSAATFTPLEPKESGGFRNRKR